MVLYVKGKAEVLQLKEPPMNEAANIVLKLMILGSFAADIHLYRVNRRNI